MALVGARPHQLGRAHMLISGHRVFGEVEAGFDVAAQSVESALLALRLEFLAVWQAIPQAIQTIFLGAADVVKLVDTLS